MWFRKEQLLSVTWAGNPAKPLVDNDPMTLSPRRSFDAWSEIVRGTAVPWSNAERVMARAVGTALVDIIVQVHAVRLLIAEHQLGQIRATLGSSREPVLVVDPAGRVMFANDALAALMGEGATPPAPGHAVAALFEPAQAVGKVLDRLSLQPWRGEWGLVQAGRTALPVSVRAEAVPGRDGGLLGFILTLTDLSDVRRAAEARRHLEAALQVSAQGPRTSDGVLGAILTNASLAAMDIADSTGVPTVAPLLEELEASAKRATALYAQIRQFSA
jgi:PAS domain-containing protein